MNIVGVDINLLTPYADNPRVNDRAVEAVMASIREFGFKVPIVIDKDNTIVAGHTRYAAAQLLGMTEVPCIIADDLTDEQVRAFRLADNKTAELSKWKMTELDRELQDLLDVDMHQFGFPEPKQEKPDEQMIDPVTQEKYVRCPHCGEWIPESEAREYASQAD